MQTFFNAAIAFIIVRLVVVADIESLNLCHAPNETIFAETVLDAIALAMAQTETMSPGMALLNSYMGKTFTGTHSPQPEDIRKIWKNSEWQNNLFAIVNLTTTNDTHQIADAILILTQWIIREIDKATGQSLKELSTALQCRVDEEIDVLRSARFCDIRSIDYFAGVLDAASENDSALRSAMKNASTPSIRYNYQIHFPGDNAVQNPKAQLLILLANDTNAWNSAIVGYAGQNCTAVGAVYFLHDIASGTFIGIGVPGTTSTTPVPISAMPKSCHSPNSIMFSNRLLGALQDNKVNNASYQEVEYLRMQLLNVFIGNSTFGDHITDDDVNEININLAWQGNLLQRYPIKSNFKQKRWVSLAVLKLILTILNVQVPYSTGSSLTTSSSWFSSDDSRTTSSEMSDNGIGTTVNGSPSSSTGTTIMSSTMTPIYQNSNVTCLLNELLGCNVVYEMLALIRGRNCLFDNITTFYDQLINNLDFDDKLKKAINELNAKIGPLPLNAEAIAAYYRNVTGDPIVQCPKAQYLLLLNLRSQRWWNMAVRPYAHCDATSAHNLLYNIASDNATCSSITNPSDATAFPTMFTTASEKASTASKHTHSTTTESNGAAVIRFTFLFTVNLLVISVLTC